MTQGEALELVRKVGTFFKFEEEELFSSNRRREVSYVRGAIMMTLHAKEWSYARIGRFFNRHHTSVIYSIERYSKLPEVLELERRIRQFIPFIVKKSIKESNSPKKQNFPVFETIKLKGSYNIHSINTVIALIKNMGKKPVVVNRNHKDCRIIITDEDCKFIYYVRTKELYLEDVEGKEVYVKTLKHPKDLYHIYNLIE